MLLAKWVPSVMSVKPVVGQAVLCNECKASCWSGCAV